MGDGFVRNSNSAWELVAFAFNSTVNVVLVLTQPTACQSMYYATFSLAATRYRLRLDVSSVFKAIVIPGKSDCGTFL